MPLEVSSREKEPGVVVVCPLGSIDSSTYDILQDCIDSIISGKSPQVLILDMDGVIFISSMGVRVILRTRKTLKALGGKLLLMNLRPQIRMVFDIIKALPQEKIFASIQELDDYLAHMQLKTLEKR